MQNGKNIVLIGMPGAGKSTLGVLLAKSINMQFIDTDINIQHYTGKALQEIIEHNGIDRFIEIEEEVISHLSCTDTVIATGGSAVYSEKAMLHMKSNGIIVFIDVPLNEIKHRINNITTRGIVMKPNDTIEKIYTERLELYKLYADISISVQNISIEKSVENIISAVKKMQ